MNYLPAGFLVLALVMGGCAGGEVQRSAAYPMPSGKAAVARTRADHEALAAWYARDAQSAQDRVGAHRKMRDAYGSSSGLHDSSGMVGHCTNIIEAYERVARENSALADLHHRLADKAGE